MRRVRGLHPDAQLRRARAAFLTLRGPDETRTRAAIIAGLPFVMWRGQLLRTIQCNGTTGRGPHAVHVPESLLWSLIDVHAYRCAFHAGGF